MGFIEDLLIKWKIAAWWKDAAKSGGVMWKLLDGWKTVIVAVIASLQLLFPAFPGFHYVTLALQAIGWAGVHPAVDPGQVALFISTVVAVGHRILKYVSQYKAFRAGGLGAFDAIVKLGSLVGV